MKNILTSLLVATTLFTSVASCAQSDKSKRPSPPATASATTSNGNTITIDYSQPSVKGRTIGAEIAPYGKVWRTGANEATAFQITKDAQIEGKHPLKAGKYGLYSIPGEKTWTIIFNKTWNQSGTEYSQADDALRVVVNSQKAPQNTEKMTFNINKEGRVNLLWGDKMVSFTVK
jgi:predicted small lipoprotein YifL